MAGLFFAISRDRLRIVASCERISCALNPPSHFHPASRRLVSAAAKDRTATCRTRAADSASTRFFVQGILISA